MKKVLLFKMESQYRDDLRVQGYLFGADDLEHCEKTVAVVSGMRGNEYTQIFEASQLVKRLVRLEEQGRLTPGKAILVIPTANPYSVNAEKRFWPADTTDINRMFPGYDKGETTQRVAAALFQVLEGFEYGIHLTSHYISGNFVPHVSIQDTGRDYTESAKAFGLSYIRFRKPTQYDTTTLNYNWQIWNTKAYSIYGGEDTRIDNDVADNVVIAILNFLNHIGVVRFGHHRGFISQVITNDDLYVVKSREAGFFNCKVKVGDFVRKGQLLAQIRCIGDGHILDEITAQSEGIVFFIQSNPLAFANGQLMMIIR